MSDERRKRATAMADVLDDLFADREGTALLHSTPWELLVAVMLSAQCTDERVNKVVADLFKKYSTFDDYLSADLHEFQKDIKSTGFYRNKAKNILASAQIIKEKHGGDVPNTMEELTALPGVARKTANVVLGNAFGKVEGLAVDTHVRRFAIRFDLSSYTDPVKIEKDLIQLLPQERWFAFGNNLIYYGREICSARPHECTDYPLTRIYPPAADIWPRSR